MSTGSMQSEWNEWQHGRNVRGWRGSKSSERQMQHSAPGFTSEAKLLVGAAVVEDAILF